ncbi:MAG: serine protein kinase RIO [Thermoprotei archaeon]|nr:MAG: serine protein kinase RIO [Thermoprotei archaeon]
MEDEVEKRVDAELNRRLSQPRLKDKDLFEVVEEVFDRRTVLGVMELRRRRCIKVLKGVVSAGKEARVYWAKGFSGEDLAVKIYLTVTAEFRKSIWRYIRGDPRYEWIGKLPRHKLMAVWARKEFSNLKRMYEAGVEVPQPCCVYQNILVMRFIGRDGVRAPLLKEAVEHGLLDTSEYEEVFWRIVDNVKKMYRGAGLVHGDLSEYNVMLWEGRTYIIDVSQAVRLDHPNAHEFLRRDLGNLVRFFGDELGVSVPTVDELIREVTEE